MRSRKTPFAAVNLTLPARDALRAATLELTSDASKITGKRLTHSDVVLHAVALAMRHREEFFASLASGTEDA